MSKPIVAIVGRPNVGKSTLLNRLAGEDRAMVSDIAGTTRDTIEATTNIDGVIYRFIDTAGLHSTDDRLEQMGIERTEQALRKARIILWMQDYIEDKTALEGYTPTKDQTLLRVINKIDLRGDKSLGTEENSDVPTYYISAKSGEGVEQLIDAFKQTANASAAYQGEVIVSSQRHYDALMQSLTALESALSALDNGISSDLLSEDIRQVMHHLGTITGEITTTEILQSIFSKFCIGK